ncbi:MAG TPA: hypothetical protein VFF06_31365 [Polyangia bacterium]|nr:hypothetical protein [Polyangia bacterium]
MRERLKRWLAAPGAPWIAIALAVALSLPSLTTGLVADDHVHQLLLREPRPFAGLSARKLDLFAFATGNPDDARALMDAGVFPWWTDPSVRLTFFRPLSSLTHALDHALWPRSAIAMHAHNLVWFALALVAVWFFYRRFLGGGAERWIAGLALALYALDDAHGPALGWVANRNAMVALALSLPALVLHDRWRRENWRPGAVLAPLVLLVGLLAGESALAAVAYLVAHALWLDRGPLARRLLALAPYALVVVAWRAGYVALGYGASGSGVYLDPAHDPAAFAAQFPSRFLLLALGQVALPWSDFGALYPYIGPRAATIMVTFAAIVVAGFVALAAPLLRRDATARFFATGAALALVPICSTFPADRLLWFVGVGAMGLIAQLFAAPRARFVGRPAIALLAGIHLVLAPPLLALRSRSMATVEIPLRRANDSLPKSGLDGKTVVLVNPPADFFAGYLAVTRESRGEPRPARIRWLSSGTSAVTVRRPDERTLIVKPERGFLENVTEQMLRTRAHPLAAGAHVALTGVAIDVTSSLPDGRPAEAKFTFDVPLEDPSLMWEAWRKLGYVPFTPPPVGGEVTLAPVDFLAACLEEPKK